MGHKYTAIQWNKNKIAYDLYLVLAITVFTAIYVVVGTNAHPSGNPGDPIILVLRALGSAAFVMLSLTLAIGPLARISPRFRPFLYNRRHLGVATFLVAAAHATIALGWYHAGGPLNPFVSLFVSNGEYDSIPGFPFEVLGFVALVILFVMAATSHDFWLNNLTAGLWKAIHMLVYPAYGLLVLHIVLGAFMTEKAMLSPVLTAASFVTVAGLHLYTGLARMESR